MIRNRAEASAKAKQLVNQMTLEERASQLRYDAPAIPRLGIPAYNWWGEGLHGVARAGTATVFPQAIAMAATFDRQLVYEIGAVVAIEARAKYNQFSKRGDRDIYKGLTLWAPNLNIFRDPRWGRGHETYGEDPHLTRILGQAYINGLQGDGEYLTVAACAKHFAVHSGPEEGRHEIDITVTPKDLYETYLPAFEQAVKQAGVESVMGAYNRVNGQPCCGSEFLLKQILRDQWEFQGHVVSDCWAIRDFHEHHMVTSSATQSAAMAIGAGCDLNCGNTYLHILHAYQQGLVTEEQITTAAERLFTTRYLLGLFDQSHCYHQIPFEKIECQEHLELSRRAAEKGIVLLKNDGVLPLNKEKLKTIGVIGPNADSRAALIGNYHGTASRYVTVLEGIQDMVCDQVRVFYAQGCHLSKDREEVLALADDRITEAQAVAEHSDIVILCLGLDETLEGEEGDEGNQYASGDKKDLSLPLSQRRLLEAVVKTGKPVVLLMMAGSAMDLNDADRWVQGILQVWYPGAQGGRAVADILFGKVSPSGKLPVTIYKDTDHLPDFEDYSMAGRTYRYLKEQALYPFGYGLTYSRVVITDSAAEICDNGVAVTVTVKNTGNCLTEEVVQIYIKNTTSPYSCENYHLSAFERISVEPGEQQCVKLVIPEWELMVVDDSGRRIRDNGHYRLNIGFHQPDQRSCELTGDRTVELILKC